MQITYILKYSLKYFQTCLNNSRGSVCVLGVLDSEGCVNPEITFSPSIITQQLLVTTTNTWNRFVSKDFSRRFVSQQLSTFQQSRRAELCEELHGTRWGQTVQTVFNTGMFWLCLNEIAFTTVSPQTNTWLLSEFMTWLSHEWKMYLYWTHSWQITPRPFREDGFPSFDPWLICSGMYIYFDQSCRDLTKQLNGLFSRCRLTWRSPACKG